MSVRTSLILAVALAGASATASAQNVAAPAPAPGDSASCCRMKSEKPAGPCSMMPGENPDAHRMHQMSNQAGGRGMVGNEPAGMEMPMPSAADQARLDSLVASMHQNKGDRKLAAMEKIIDELMSHRKAMMEHMQSMNDRRAGCPGGEAGDHTQHH